MSYLRKCSEKRRNRHGCHLVTSIAENLAYSLLFKRLSPEDNFIKYEGAVYAVTLVIGVICLSEFSGVGKLHDEKLQAGNEVVRLIDEYNKTHKMQCQSLSDLGLKPVGDNFYEYKGMWFLLDANDKAFELRFLSPYGGDINYDYTYSSDVQEWDDTIIW